MRKLFAAGCVAATIITITIAVPAGAASAQTPSPWDAVAQCESGGNWAIESGNGFSGGLQFTQGTWNRTAAAMGRTDLVGLRASSQSREVQIAVAEFLAFEAPGGGLGHWPHCGRYHNGVRTPDLTVAAVAPRHAGNLERLALRFDGSQVWVTGWTEGDVHLYVNGVGWNLGPADRSRPDVPLGANGFDHVVQVDVGPGVHQLCVYSVGDTEAITMGCGTVQVGSEWFLAL